MTAINTICNTRYMLTASLTYPAFVVLFIIALLSISVTQYAIIFLYELTYNKPYFLSLFDTALYLARKSPSAAMFTAGKRNKPKQEVQVPW